MSDVMIVAFYKFVNLPDYRDLREPLYTLCDSLEIKGTILLAEEGINSTIAGTRGAILQVLTHLRTDPRFSDLIHKESFSVSQPFERLKVRLKREIVTLGVEGINPNDAVGEYVEPDEWNALIRDPNVLLIDTRNDFEVEIGTFQGAINPGTDAFGQFPAFVDQALSEHKDRKIAMFCTGGIRCEKATAYLIQQGFSHVYHLKGGILRYLEQVAPDESLWDGECFVFDERVSVDHALQPGKARFCSRCKALLKDDSPCGKCGE